MEQTPFEFPKPFSGKPTLGQILELLTGAEGARRNGYLPSTPGTIYHKNVKATVARLRASGIENPFRKPFVIDIDSSKAHCTFNKSPCLTRARAHGFWLLNRARRMTVLEQARLQGFEGFANAAMQMPTIKDLKLPQGLSRRQVGQLLGNAMTVTVVREVLRAALTSVGVKF